MAIHGKDAEVVVGQYDVTELFRSLGWEVEVDTAETTTFRKDWKTHVAGQAGSTVDLEGFYDADRADEVHGTLGVATPFPATFGVGGLSVGAPVEMALVQATNATETAGVGDAVLLNWALQTTDEVRLGKSLAAPTVAHVADYNGPAVDFGAAVTGASWVVHFHLFALSATNVVFTVQDSADGSTDWQTVTSAVSGTLVAPGVVRVTGTGNVRRYVRINANFTGGATSGMFTVSFSRKAV